MHWLRRFWPLVVVSGGLMVLWLLRGESPQNGSPAREGAVVEVPPAAAALAPAPAIPPVETPPLPARWRKAGAVVEDAWTAAASLDGGTGPVQVAILRMPGKPYPVRLEFKQPGASQREPLAYAADRLIWKPDDSLTLDQLPTGLQSRYLEGAGAWLLTGIPPHELDPLLARLQSDPRTTYAEPDPLVYALGDVDDPLYLEGKLWGLHNTGQDDGLADADIDAPESWEVRTGARSIIVAVIDSGVRLTHEDIRGNLWTNPGEIAGNGLDDDANGWVDDIHGIDAVSRDGDPDDPYGHGSHVAGTIGATGNNGLGMTGVAREVQIMALRFIDATGSGTHSDAIDCLDYARRMGVRITNNSWGGAGASESLQSAFAACENAGMLHAVAAGNDAANNDIEPMFPTNLPLQSIVSVAATNRLDQRPSFSNYGAGLVHLGAPGADILSLGNSSDTSYQSMSGTSMATPHVAGALALLAAQFPDDPPTGWINRLLRSVDPLPSLASRVQSGGRLNLATALTASAPEPLGDDFAEAMVLKGSSLVYRGTLAGATLQPTEPRNAAGFQVSGSIWFSWETAVDGITIVNLAGTAGDTVLEVYSGTDLKALELVVSNDDYAEQQSPRVQFVAQAGVPYRLRVAMKSASSPGVVMLAMSGPPENDKFANATPLQGLPAYDAGTTLNASREDGEPAHAGYAAGGTVWYRWTAAISSRVGVSTRPSANDTVLAVYRAGVAEPTMADLIEVAANDDDPLQEGTHSRVLFEANAGETFYFAIGDKSPEGGPVSIRLFAPPPNDNFADRIAVFGTQWSASANPLFATLEPGEPIHGGQDVVGSLWWQWSCIESGYYQLDTSDIFSPYVLAVYAGASLLELTEVGSDLKGGPLASSRLVFKAEAGTTYAIAAAIIDGFNFTPLALNFAQVQRAANDDIADAGILDGLPTLESPLTATSSINGATREPDEPGFYDNSLWWKWTAPAAGRFTLVTEGSTFDTYLELFKGSPGQLVLVAEDDDSGRARSSRIDFDATAGTTYWIRVTGYWQAEGDAVLTLSPFQVLLNDTFAQATRLEGEIYGYRASNVGATKEMFEPVIRFDDPALENQGGASVWFRWTAPADGTWIINTSGSEIAHMLAVYTGDAFANLQRVGSSALYGGLSVVAQVEVAATAGTTYRIVVDGGFNGETVTQGPIVLSILKKAGNDAFADRTSLSGSVVTFNTHNFGATREDGEPYIGGISGGRSLWWEWTVPETGLYEITTAGSSFLFAGRQLPLNTVLGLYGGSSLATLNQVARNDDRDVMRDKTSRIVQSLPRGLRLKIAVDTWRLADQAVESTPQGLVRLTIRPYKVPANDSFAKAIPISGTAAYYETSNDGTSSEYQEPEHDSRRKGHSLWWRWTAPVSGRFHFSTGGNLYDIDAAEDTVIAVYTGTTLADLQLVTRNLDGAGSDPGLSLATIDAVAGTTYHIAVDAFATGSLHFQLTPPPVNDAFADAIGMRGINWSTTGHNVGATPESGEPSIDPPDHPKAFKSVWWKWTAPVSGLTMIDTLGSRIFSIMAVYTGDRVDNLTEIVKSDWVARDPFYGDQPRGGCARVTFNAVAGTTYHIRVDGSFYASASAGTIALSLRGPQTGQYTLADWLRTYFGSDSATGDAALDADPDGDGWFNLAEYYLGGDPLSSGSIPRPVFAVREVNGAQLSGLVFSSGALPEAAVLQGQTSADLIDWTSADPAPLPLPPAEWFWPLPANPDRVFYRITQAPAP